MKNSRVHLFIVCLFTFWITFFMDIGNISCAARITVTDAGMHQRMVTGSSANSTWKKSVSIIKGDVDNNGKVDSADITLLQKYLANPNTAINKSTADLNDDGKVSITDLSQLKSKVSKEKNNQANTNNRTSTTISQSYNFKVVYPTNGLYSLQPMCAPQKELTVKDASTANNANVFIYTIASNAHKHPSHQKWKVERISGTEWYKITAENSGKALNIHNGSATNGTNVDIYPYGGKMHQFRFIDTGNGYYAIQANVGNLNTDSYVLDVENARNANGANVSIHQFTNNPAQRWRMVRRAAATIKPVEPRNILKGDVDGNGKVEQADLTLLSKYIVDNTIKINTANADMNGDGKISNTDASQLMSKLPKDNTPKVVNVADGWYRIRRANSYTVVSAFAQVTEGQTAMVVSEYNGSGYINYGYLFYLENNGNGYFTLKDGDRGRLLTAIDLTGKNATRVVCRSKNNSNAQLWRLLDAGDGYYYVESKLKDRWAFSPHDGTTRTPVELRIWNIEEVPYKYNKWVLEKVDDNRILKGDVDGNGKVEKADLTLLTKYISNKSVSFQRLALADMNGDGKITNTDASQLMLKLPKENNYKVAHPVNGLYSIQPMCAPQKELTVQNASTANNANVFIYSIASDWHKQPSHQKWYIERLGNSEWYKITAENSGKALNVHNGFAANGTNVDIYPYGARMHQFRFIDIGDGYYAIQANIGNINTASYVLDVASGANVNGANVQVWGFNAGSSQKWKLLPREAATETVFDWPIPGCYQVTTRYKYSNGVQHGCRYYSGGKWKKNTTPYGIDIYADEGTKVYAPADGVVCSKNDEGGKGFGKSFEILHDDGTISLFAHLSNHDYVYDGKKVKKGDLIALSGHTGNVKGRTGNHLHYELSTHDPYVYHENKGDLK